MYEGGGKVTPKDHKNWVGLGWVGLEGVEGVVYTYVF